MCRRGLQKPLVKILWPNCREGCNDFPVSDGAPCLCAVKSSLPEQIALSVRYCPKYPSTSWAPCCIISNIISIFFQMPSLNISSEEHLKCSLANWGFIPRSLCLWEHFCLFKQADSQNSFCLGSKCSLGTKVLSQAKEGNFIGPSCWTIVSTVQTVYNSRKNI